MAAGRVVPLKDYRNIGIIAQKQAGKSTTTERILYCTSRDYQMREVDEETAANDWMEQQERGNAIPAAVTASWNDHRINMIDTPGHADSAIEVKRALRVLDGAVCLFSSVAGIDPKYETIWRQADAYFVPRICFVNKMDHLGADFFRIMDMIASTLGARLLVIQLPIGAEESFKGIVDLVKMQAVVWSGEGLSAKFQYESIPADLQELAREYQALMIENIVGLDDEALEDYIKGIELDEATIKKLIRQGTIGGSFVPVLCGSSVKNSGFQPLLDAVVDYLPSPVDLPAMKGTDPDDRKLVIERKASDDEPFAGLAFKVVGDPSAGSLTFVRVYSGKLESGSYVLNASKGKKGNIGGILEMHGNGREDIRVALTGDIVALAGLKDMIAGETLSEPEKPLVLERIDLPDPVINMMSLMV